jgi:hypothetical protein
MKILFLGGDGTDYLSDCLLHGLYMNPNIELVNSPKAHLMYMDTFGEGKKKLTDVYGKGFTIYGTLPKYNEHDPEDIRQKISNNYFNYIIFSRRWMDYPYTKLILKHYDYKNLIMLDGRDAVDIVDDFIKHTTYFKRELIYVKNRVYPIHFGFPEEKIQTTLPKTRKLARVQPNWNGKKPNYIHVKEQDYYDDYRSSFFGRTTKKAGWDCMRHYEIMACRALPYWPDLPQCPPKICTNLPKSLLLEAKNLYERNPDEYFFTEEGSKIYKDLEEQIFKHFRQHCTTQALADYVIGVMESLK